ncbi:MAG TPA: NAD(P)H-binding protein [Gaiellaceae bacterium]
MILVTGGTGFVGPKVVHALRVEDRPVRALVRDSRSDEARRLEAWGCELAVGDVTDAESLRRAVEGCTTVVHLVAIISGRPEAFERVMKQGTRDLVGVAKDAGVGRLVLMSALGVDQRSKDLVPYYGAKWEMEQAVKGSGLDHVIFRPSFVFGRDGGILPMFMRQVRLAPFTAIAGDGERLLQPIWVDDVAAFYTRAVAVGPAPNRTFDLGGPDRITWNDLYARMRRTLGVRRRPTIHLPMGLMRTGAAVAEKLPRPPVTRDQLTMLEDADNIGDVGPANETFGVTPIGIDEQLRRASG